MKRQTWLGHVLGVAVLSFVGASSCDEASGGSETQATDDGSGSTGTGTGTEGGSATVISARQAMPATPTFSAVEATNIVFTIHQGEIRQAQLALEKAVSLEVKEFAQHMIDEHRAAVTRMQGMVPGSQPAGDATSALLAHETQLITADLQALPPEQFDVAYMTAQVAAHSQALGMTDGAIAPSVQVTGDAANGIDVPALQAEVATFRGALVQHLVDSLQIQQRVRSAASGGNAGGLPPGGTTNG